jgi:hypothetical protein
MRDLFGRTTFAAAQPWAPARRQVKMGCPTCGKNLDTTEEDADLACATCKKKKKKVWSVQEEGASAMMGQAQAPSPTEAPSCATPLLLAAGAIALIGIGVWVASS